MTNRGRTRTVGVSRIMRQPEFMPGVEGARAGGGPSIRITISGLGTDNGAMSADGNGRLSHRNTLRYFAKADSTPKHGDHFRSCCFL